MAFRENDVFSYCGLCGFPLRASTAVASIISRPDSQPISGWGLKIAALKETTL